MKIRKKLFLVMVVGILLCSVAMNVWQYIRMKPLRESVTHDLIILRSSPMLEILSETNGVSFSEQKINALRSGVWAIFKFSAKERETYRFLGLVKDNENENEIDRLVRETREKHNRLQPTPLHGAPEP